MKTETFETFQKLGLILCLLLCLVSCVLICASCDSGDASNESTALEAVTHTHNWTEATCTSSRKCTVCGATEGKAIGHDYGEWVVTKAATCTQVGEKEAVCSVCGVKKVDTIPLSSAHISVVADSAIEATCTMAGKTAGSHCSACGTVIVVQETVKALGHDYGQGYITKAATCTGDGIKKVICQVCGDEHEEVIPKTEHDFDEGVVTSPATCEEAGEVKYTCKSCQYTKTETVAALGHTPNSNSICTMCGKVAPKMTSAERENAATVRYISDWNVSHEDKAGRFALTFSLEDTNGNRLAVPAALYIRIVNEQGETVYEATKIVKTSDYSIQKVSTMVSDNGKAYQATIYIDDSDITAGDVTEGDIYFTVYNSGYFVFDEISMEIDDLPKKPIQIKLPEMPMKLSWYRSTTFQVTELTYEIDKSDIVFTYSGEKIYDKEGYDSTQWVAFRYKLYDSDGYVVADDSVIISNSMTIGDKVRNKTFSIKLPELPEGCTEYTLVLEDYK